MTKMSCDHYPLIGLDAKDCWEIIEQSMHHIVRRCTKCGAVEESILTSYHPNQFMTEKRRRELTTQREQHAKDIEQPWINGKPNEKFAKAFENEPDKLTKTYSPKELNQLQMPKLAKAKDAQQSRG